MLRKCEIHWSVFWASIWHVLARKKWRLGPEAVFLPQNKSPFFDGQKGVCVCGGGGGGGGAERKERGGRGNG